MHLFSFIQQQENRDPKVFWHEMSKAYIMTLWLEKHDFAILRSTDLVHWEQSEKLTLEEPWDYRENWVFVPLTE